MRNGQNPELAKAAEPDQDLSALDDLTLKNPNERKTAVEHSAAVEEHAEHDFSSSSFSFEMERSSTDRQEPTKRIQTFPKLEQERPRETRQLSTAAATATSPATAKQAKATSTAQQKTLLTPKGGKRGQSLLDRYISFLAKLIKAFEKFLMRKFNRGEAQKQHTQEAAEEIEAPVQEVSKKKKLPIRHGPGI